MSLALIDKISNQAKFRNESYLLALKGAVTGLTQSKVSRKNEIAKTLISNFVSFEAETLYEQSAKLAELAYSDAMRDIGAIGEVSETLKNHVKANATSTLISLSAQADRDSDKSLRVIRGILIQTGILSRAKGWSASAAFTAVQKKEANVAKFSFVDRSGKLWSSSRYMFVLLRGHYLNVYNEVYLYALAEKGVFEAFVNQENKEHKHHGLNFNILLSETGELTYAEIEAEVFHSNAKALVSARK